MFTCGDAETLEVAEMHLQASGISLAQAAELGIDVLSKQDMQGLGYDGNYAGVLYRYWDPMLRAYEKVEVFHRVRLLQVGRAASFSAQTKMSAKYLQPKGTLNQLYLPRIVSGEEFDWASLFSQTDKTLFITEGEKKSIAACACGIPCMGLGGVDMWRAAKRGINELPMLTEIDLRDRSVIVVFDTDTASGLKVNVMQSAQRLMDHLALRGAIPELAVLPPNAEGHKVALDDYLMSHTVEEFYSLVEHHAVPHATSLKLTQYAQRYVFINSLGRFMPTTRESGSVDNPITKERLGEMLGLELLGMPVLQQQRMPQGQPPVLRPLQAPTPVQNALLMFGGLTKCRSITYAPGKSKLVETDNGVNYNLWEGWCCEYEDDTNRVPQKERRVEILDLWDWALDNLFGDEPVAREFIDHWIFYPIKYPGTKLNTLVLLTSIRQGIGKTFVGDMLGKYVYGFKGSAGPNHASKIVEGRLEESFNGYMYAKSFVLGDDIASQHKNGVYKRMMSYVTSEEIEINMKNVPQFTIENCVNFWLTSNDPAPFFLTDNDRRALVHIPRKAVKDEKKYARLKAFFESGEAGPTLLHYAREGYFEGKFNPNGEAPWTAAKNEVVVNSKSQLRDWIEGLVAAAMAGELSRPVATTREIMALLEFDDSRLSEKANDRAVGLMLSESGAIYYGGGEQLNIKNKDGTKRRERVWVLGDPMEVMSMPKEVVAQMVAEIPLKHTQTGKEENKIVRMARKKY
jgi:hypothetical protein